jgi:hypothetical protein
MIGQYLSNTNESVTIHILQKNFESKQDLDQGRGCLSHQCNLMTYHLSKILIDELINEKKKSKNR